MTPEKDFVRPFELMQAIQQGCLVVTGNLRLARSLIGQFDQSLKDKQQIIWNSARVLPWSSWLHQIWENGLMEGLIEPSIQVLSNEQELQVWQQIIADSEVGSALLRLYPTAKKIQSAWSLVNEWQVPLTQEAVIGQYDAEIFLQWQEKFKSICEENQWITSSEQINELLKLNSARLSLAANAHAVKGKKIILIGFDELTPAQKALLEHLKLDILWYEFAPEYQEHSVNRIACHDSREEMHVMAQWVRHQVQRDLALKIGVIVPELAQQRQALIHVFDNCLSPANLSPNHLETQHLYNLSLGRPLSEYPLIISA
ncbi:MAG: hypothetical protein MI744_05535, partial [Pseudomonadales bacterium]|nr:hypothetical protein [Pseudomonadales bacterium]